MFYTIFVLFLGVYFGQEYNMPLIKDMISNTIAVLTTPQIEHQQQPTSFTLFVNYIKNLLGRND